MDLATIIGLVVGAGLMLAAIGDQMQQFIDIPSVFIVIGGAISATFISLPLARVTKFVQVAKVALFSTKDSIKSLMEQMVHFGEIARRDGILALEGVMEDVKDPFLRRGLQLAVDGNDPETISATLSEEMESLSARHDDGRKLFEALGKYAPAFGMIGTLIGLILMLANLDDPDKIAPSMAIALLTTLYGAIVANLVVLPIADKLSVRNDEELARMGVVVAGVVAIQSGDNPKVVEQKLQVFLPPKDRAERT